MSLTVLLDAPGTPVTRTQIAKLGSFKDKRYGEFQITAADVKDWQAGLARLPGQRAAIDLDHSADRPQPFRSTEAAGWITSVDLEGDKVMASTEWTPLGEKAITEKRYLFFSPTYGPHSDETGAKHENVLTGGALTNRPFLGMPMVTLASEGTLQTALDREDTRQFLLDAITSKQRDNLDTSDFAIPAQRAYPIHDLAHARNALARVAQNGTGAEQAQVKTAVYKRYPELKPVADSRRSMELTTEILTALSLDTEADEAKVLDAIKALSKPAPTLEQLAKEKGVKVLDSDAHAKLLADHERVKTLEDTVKTLAEERAEEKFTTAWKGALEKGYVKDEPRDQHHKVFTLDNDLGLAMIEALPPLVNTKGSEWDNKRSPIDDQSPSGKLTAKARKVLEDAGKPVNEKTLGETMIKLLEGEI